MELEPRENYFNSWDLVIVDEAQDIDWNSWQDIEKMCTTEGQLFVFMDSNQSIYRPSADLTTLLGAEGYELNVNLRNTRQIARSTEILYAGPLILAPGPLGVAPKIYQASKYEEAIELCSKLIVELTVKDSLHKSDITILCRDKNTREKIKFDLNLHKIFTCNASERKFDTVCVETVPLFKGLESPIVIAMCDAEWANSLEMSYVSISRARALLYVIGNVRESIIEKASKNS
jgi:ATP-dependent exoDNAse (exonuclease V) beta subunit